ncbi:MAG: DUF255 domain-containing protein [Flavobacteriales bacterium]|nr:DUF255 domain-containing protein [Flavobacteriales bacterium]
MLRIKHTFWILVVLALTTFSMTLQVVDPVDWDFSVQQDGNEATLYFDATVDKPWHMYSQHLDEGGPIPTYFEFEKSEHFELLGETGEMESVQVYDPNFKMDLAYFEGDCSFDQKIKVKSSEDFVIKGWLEFMVCNDKECLPPEMVDFEFNVKGNGAAVSPGSEGSKDKKEDHSEISMPVLGHEDQASDVTGSQVKEAVQWEFTSKKIEDSEYEVTYKAIIDKGWHMYSQHLDPDKIGPVATYFEVDKEASGISSLSEVSEPKPKVEFDPNFDMDLAYFEDEVEFTQTAQISDPSKAFKGWLEFMVCNDKECLPPEIVDFEIDLSTGKSLLGEGTGSFESSEYDNAKYELPCVDVSEPYSKGKEFASENTTTSGNDDDQNMLVIFLLGFLGGLVALVTPCVFPMIPLTVSFFTKGSEDKRKGKIRAFTYGFFIFLIYTAVAIPFHVSNQDPEVLNEIATGFILNMVFFTVFVFFAGSFFGYYELTLPSSIANKADSASNKAGIGGIFFMALTLAIVSFSCTGPILGSLLAGVLKGGPWPLTAALAGFGIALGLPFALFAMFPQWLNKLPSSGGWLNTVKVVLGFVELALAVKFLSNADLVYQLGWVKRETFFLIWFILAIACALYLFGLYKFPHDSPKTKLSGGRIGWGIAFLAFAIYLFPGMLKSPWWEQGLMAGFPPYKHYSWYEKDSHCPLDLDCTDDFYIAQDMAKEKAKPIFIDFTGHACVNCRRMEENVWPEDKVMKLLNEEFQVVSLYVDDKRKLEEGEEDIVLVTYNDGSTKDKKIRTIGNKWSTLEILSFENSTQPLYAILSPDGCLMNAPVGYTPDVDEYVKFLKEGIEANKHYQKQKDLAFGN